MTDVDEEAVERRLARLREDWGEFPVAFEQETVPAEDFDPFLADARDGYTGGGYAWSVREPGETAPVTSVARFESSPDDGRDVRVHSLYVVFEGRYEGGHVEIQPGELNGAAWFRELPANLHPVAEPLASGWSGGQTGDGGGNT